MVKPYERFNHLSRSRRTTWHLWSRSNQNSPFLVWREVGFSSPPAVLSALRSSEAERPYVLVLFIGSSQRFLFKFRNQTVNNIKRNLLSKLDLVCFRRFIKENKLL
ncbi:hypothetical protein CRENBAI_016042 [Crenichthys baileyi]|uniref:Uncharacterized protein n=1 Tax=Crenichthys baileyi TaxID=28760 RepID=A0AAV9S069_9TELE